MTRAQVPWNSSACLSCGRPATPSSAAMPRHRPCRGDAAGDRRRTMPPHPETWLRVTPQGLHCEPGGFFIDPVRPVDRAVITHGHADHARPGHGAVLATAETLAIMRARMGEAAAGA